MPADIHEKLRARIARNHNTHPDIITILSVTTVPDGAVVVYSRSKGAHHTMAEHRMMYVSRRRGCTTDMIVGEPL